MTVTETETATEPERPDVEVVDPKELERRLAAEHRAAVELHQHSAVDAIADAALATPGMAGVEEFKSICLQARLLSMSAAAPEHIAGNPHVALHIVLIGRDLGISPSAAVELIDIIKTKNGLRPSMSPQLLNGQIRRLGLGSIVKAIDNDDRCVALAMGPGGRLDMRCRKAQSYPFHWYDVEPWTVNAERQIPDERCTCSCTPDLWIGDTEFSWQDAQLAGLAGLECTPHEHKKETKQGRSGGSYESCPCSFGYSAYWPRMRWWRASGFCADDWFPEAGLGLYTAEELGAFVDADGRAIDVEGVEIPPGYEAHKGTPGYVAPPSEEELELRIDTQTRLLSLPEIGRKEWLKRKASASRLTGTPTHKMDLGQLRMANSVLGGVEAYVRTEMPDWDADAALADVRARYVMNDEGQLVERTDEEQTDVDSDAGDDETSQSSSADVPTDEATTDEPPEAPAKRTRQRKRDQQPRDEQSEELKRAVADMAPHGEKLTEIIGNVAAMSPSEAAHVLDGTFMIKLAVDQHHPDTIKSRLVIELCRQFLAEQTPTETTAAEQPTLDGTAES